MALRQNKEVNFNNRTQRYTIKFEVENGVDLENIPISIISSESFYFFIMKV